VLTSSDQCNVAGSLLFVQYSCVQPQEVLAQKYTHLSYVACIGVFCAALFIIVIYFMKRHSKMNQLDWDIQTITPGDYTLQYEITDEAYHWFLNEVYYPNNYEAQGVSIGLAFKTYMKTELERILTNKLVDMRGSGKDMSNIKINEIKIADITFAFDNAELI